MCIEHDHMEMPFATVLTPPALDITTPGQDTITASPRPLSGHHLHHRTAAFTFRPHCKVTLVCSPVRMEQNVGVLQSEWNKTSVLFPRSNWGVSNHGNITHYPVGVCVCVCVCVCVHVCAQGTHVPASRKWWPTLTDHNYSECDPKQVTLNSYDRISHCTGMT